MLRSIALYAWVAINEDGKKCTCDLIKHKLKCEGRNWCCLCIGKKYKLPAIFGSTEQNREVPRKRGDKQPLHV